MASVLPESARRPKETIDGTYPHPSFPGPEAPSVERVTQAKKAAIQIIKQSKEYAIAINQITLNTETNDTYILYKVDKFGSPMLDESITMYSLLSYEMVWDELLSSFYNEMGNIGMIKGRLNIQRENDQVIVSMEWNV